MLPPIWEAVKEKNEKKRGIGLRLSEAEADRRGAYLIDFACEPGTVRRVAFASLHSHDWLGKRRPRRQGA